MDISPPHTLVVKSVRKVNTAFFPWSSSVIVPACCFSYEVLKEEKKEGYEEHVKVDEDDDDDDVDDHFETEKMYSRIAPSEIKVLKPITETTESTAETEMVDSKCCKMIEHDIIPSPLGSRKSPYMDTSYGHDTHSNSEYQQKYYKSSYLQCPQQRTVCDTIQEPRKHQCEYCFKSFKRSSSLSNHRMIHKNDKTFKCNQCNMCFLRKSDLGKHMVIHSGSKPYQCNVCGKRFSQSSNMLTHQRRHTGIRPYSCSICGKSFYRKVDVRRHASVHRGEYN